AVDAAVSAAVDEAVDAAVTNTTDIVKVQAVDNVVKKFGVSLMEACETLGITIEKYEETKERAAQNELKERAAQNELNKTE
ncbi:MAG: hypothetical protein Q4C91_17990, partial [Eubacteriales bacterium]|nr:hypothetical protein [Eubacteriales bacterium]